VKRYRAHQWHFLVDGKAILPKRLVAHETWLNKLSIREFRQVTADVIDMSSQERRDICRASSSVDLLEGLEALGRFCHHEAPARDELLEVWHRIGDLVSGSWANGVGFAELTTWASSFLCLAPWKC